MSLLIRGLRVSLGMSQRELAFRTGVEQALISRIERGREARLSTCERLVRGMGSQLVCVASPMRAREDLIAELVAWRLAAEKERIMRRRLRHMRSGMEERHDAAD